MLQVVIVGNGVLGLMTAYRLLKRERSVKITLIGSEARVGCASLAAAAMFNSFAEIDAGTLNNTIEKQKFEFNHLSTAPWKPLLEELRAQSTTPLNFGFGTFVINNHSSDTLEDENFAAIIAALKVYKEAHELVHYRFRQSRRLSPRNGLTAYFVLSPVSGLYCHRCRARTGRPDRRQGRGARTTRLRRTPLRFAG